MTLRDCSKPVGQGSKTVEMRKSSPFLAHRGEIRHQVFRRDIGICRKCGLNTLDLHAALTYVQQKCHNLAPGWWPLVFRSFKEAVGRRASRFPRSLWDANMIVPRSRGGREELDNFETLCLECHRIETNRVIYGKEGQ